MKNKIINPDPDDGSLNPSDQSMNTPEYDDKTLTLEQARAILGENCKLTDPELQEVITTIRTFCEIVYVNYLHSLEIDKSSDADNSDNYEIAA